MPVTYLGKTAKNFTQSERASRGLIRSDFASDIAGFCMNSRKTIPGEAHLVSGTNGEEVAVDRGNKGARITC